MRSRTTGSVLCLATLASLCGCDAKIDGSLPNNASTPASAGSGSGGGPTAQPMTGIDPGRVGIHRLNNHEYDNTVRDLLGTSTQPASAFTIAEEGLHFDNTASALGMIPSQYDGFFDAAEALMNEALASDAQRARFLSCTPAAAHDACAQSIVQSFGQRVYRRPLTAAETERVLGVYDADLARGQSGGAAIAQAVRAMLASANFLYRVERDPNPTSTTPHALSGFELATRLSYLTWSTMPDQALFEAAGNGALAEPAQLEAAVDRLLADTKADAFVESFAGQWLDLRKLLTHSTVPQIFPSFTPALVDAMIAEGQQWFHEFLAQDRPLSEFFSADFNYVNDGLAELYGMPKPGSATQLVRVQVTTDQRRGFLGLASFLTHTSVPSRTSPTARGAWVLGELLCSPPPPPPPDVPKLDAGADPATAEPVAAANIRERLEAHRQTGNTCNGCHAQFDPIGLGLERYDGIGSYREQYPNGDAIDTAGVMPDGSTFSSAAELGTILSKDARFPACVASMLYDYALGRDVEDYDAATLQTLNSRWAARGLTLRNLMKEVVLSDAFRFRRGEAP